MLPWSEDIDLVKRSYTGERRRETDRHHFPRVPQGRTESGGLVLAANAGPRVPSNGVTLKRRCTYRPSFVHIYPSISIYLSTFGATLLSPLSLLSLSSLSPLSLHSLSSLSPLSLPPSPHFALHFPDSRIRTCKGKVSNKKPLPHAGIRYLRQGDHTYI